MSLQAADIPDIVTSTLRDLGPGKWTDLTTDIQDCYTIRRLMKGSRMKTFTDGGYEFQWNIMKDAGTSARSVGLGAQDVVDVTDVMIQATHPFRHYTFNYAFEHREPAFNRGKAAIYDLVKSRRIAEHVGFIKLLERHMWRVPGATSDNITGIPYWIVKNNTTGFNGTTPSGYSTVAGLSPTTYPRWANYTGQYTNISVDDFIVLLDTALDKTGFEPLVDMPTYNTGDQYEIYTTQVGRAGMKRLAMEQNDDLGFDLDPAYNKVYYRRVPLVWIPQLDEDTTDPFYGINWGEFKMAVLGGWWMKETKVEIQPGQHTVTAVHTDCTLNPFTRNRRRHFVLAKGTTMPS